MKLCFLTSNNSCILTCFPLHFAGASLKQFPCAFAHRIRHCFPLHFAGASLKPSAGRRCARPFPWFSPAFRGGLIEATCTGQLRQPRRRFSPAFRGGLIEALQCYLHHLLPAGFPLHFAGASLKHLVLLPHPQSPSRFSPAFRGGLIEAFARAPVRSPFHSRFPLHFAGASLKPGHFPSFNPRFRAVFPCISRGPH